MYSDLKSTKVGTRYGCKKNSNCHSKKSGAIKVQSKFRKMRKISCRPILIDFKGNHSVYCKMYDQEAKDISQAVDTLSKYAKNR